MHTCDDPCTGLIDCLEHAMMPCWCKACVDRSGLSGASEKRRRPCTGERAWQAERGHALTTPCMVWTRAATARLLASAWLMVAYRAELLSVQQKGCAVSGRHRDVGKGQLDGACARTTKKIHSLRCLQGARWGGDWTG